MFCLYSIDRPRGQKMFELDRVLAQSIVDRAMAILPCNVNVMDSQGLIMGSGEAGRLDSRHEGAQLVLSNRRIIEIDSQLALCLKGVQPGINLPLMHDEKLIGVLGLTGEPEKLRTYAELLRMTAEMLVEQKCRESNRQWRNQRSEDLLAQLLGTDSCSARLLDEAAQLGLNPQLARLPVVFEFPGQVSLASVSQWLTARASDSWCLGLSSQSLLWCCPTRHRLEPMHYLERLDAQGWPPARMVVGTPAGGVQPLRRVLAGVKELLTYGQAVVPDERLLLLSRYRLASLLWAQREEAAAQALLEIIDQIATRDANGQLMETLRCWCRHNGQMQMCAEALGLHRNTLRYRMDKIAEITAMDLNNLDDVVALYVAIQLAPR